jgi:16S rRNA (cytosine1402-N4)-methyltransferase
MQLDREERGFSFSKNGPLDMRMDAQAALTAKDIVNQYSEKELSDIIWSFGEERLSRRIASRIVQERSRKKILTTSELEQVIFHSVPKSYRYGRIHPATRTFQALRIAVNDELGALKTFLSGVISILKPGGRAVIISFHSLEDRMVKLAFREFEKSDAGSVLTKKPVTASEAEIEDNPRARSAKLRAFEKDKEGSI